MAETLTQTAAGAFDAEQKRYLEGFASGIAAVRMTGGLAAGGAGGGRAAGRAHGPDAIHIKAQDRTVKDGGKLCEQEKWKRAENPFDGHNRLIQEAAAGKQPKPEDNFRWRYHGLFWVAPNQVSYMCRLRIPNGILHHWQFAGVADLADQHGGGYVHVTTRANLQVREISPEHAQPFLDGLTDIGLTARGSGADNIRNVTGSSTAGIDAAGTARHAPAGQVLAQLDPQRPLALRPAAQVQRRLRRRRRDADPGGDQRHRLPGGGGAGRRRRARPASGCASCSAASRATGTSPATPASCSSPRIATRSPTRSSGCSSRTATGPTATRAG